MNSTTENKLRRTPTRSIPSALIYEQWQGKPIYYKGYRDVLAGKKTMEETRSCSDLQSVLAALNIGILGLNVNRKNIFWQQIVAFS